MIKSKIEGIFQTPVYRTVITQDFTKKQLSFIDKNKAQSQMEYLKKETRAGNITSSNKGILDEDIFKNLKQELELIIEDYFEKVVSPSSEMTPYITQSWLNYTEANQFHHTHAHENSYLSGVLYFNCHETLDRIKFYSNNYHTIRPESKNYNVFNSDNWWFPVKTKEVLIFPSSLTHGVETKQGDNTRISLAFNVFIKGYFGSYKKATELILK